MWKKADPPQAEPPEPKDSFQSGTESRVGERPRTRPTVAGAGMGSSIRIQGDITGDEDLVIQGFVEGSVDLSKHAVTVGPEGVVKANIKGRHITIEGRVDGDLIAEERVTLRSTARVEGDIASPRVAMEDGARFRGAVDMGEAPTPADGSRSSEFLSVSTSSTSSKASSSSKSKSDSAADVRRGTNASNAKTGSGAGS
jgi:cytoskeletal protein CcmA (bactofilin family)